MEQAGAIGSVGTYDAKLSAGVISLSVGVNVDLAAELTKVQATVTSDFEKAAIGVVVGILKGIV